MLTQWHLLPPLTSTLKSSLFTHVHSGPLSLAARLHGCHTRCSPYVNNFWPSSGQNSTCTYTHAHIHMHLHTHKHTCMHKHVHMQFVLIYMSVYITQAHMHIHTQSYMNVHTCTHTCTHTPLSRVWEEMFGFYFLMHKGPSQSDSFFTDPFCLFNCWYRLSPHESKRTHISELKFTYALGCNEELKKYRCWGSRL